MNWIDKGYRQLWETAGPASKESPNAPSAFEHKELVNDTIKEIVEAGGLTRLPRSHRPTVMSPIDVVAKPHSDKFRLAINMRYVNKHLAKMVFAFEGLVNLADIAEKGDHLVSYNLKPACYHMGLIPMSRRFVGIKWKGVFYEYTCLAFGLSTGPWVFSKVMRELVMYWKRCGIKNLPYFDDLFFPKKGSRACRFVGIRIVKKIASKQVSLSIFKRAI
jgi:hypothetical protein